MIKIMAFPCSRLRRRSLVIAAVLGLGLMPLGQWQPAAAAVAGKKPRASRAPLCDRVAAMIHLRHGNMDYLVPCEAVMKGFGLAWRGGMQNAFAVFRQRRGMIDTLVKAVLHPAHVAALRDKLLMRSNFYRSVPPQGRPWKFGSEEPRMLLADYLAARAGRLFDAGHRAEAQPVAEAALLLASQESCLLGRSTVLFFWKRFHRLSPLDMKSINALPPHQADYWVHRWAAPLALGLSPRSKKEIKLTYEQALARKARIGKALQVFLHLCQHPPGGRARAGAALGRSLLAVATVTRDTAEWALVLRYVAWMRQQKPPAVEDWMPQLVAEKLPLVARFVHAHAEYAQPDRSAILRWIKEAMGP